MIFFICLANSTFAQIDEKPAVGFFCGEDLSQPEIAAQYESLIKGKKYQTIIKGLYSKNLAENFFSVIVAEKLKSLNKIVLSEKDYETILEIKKSNRTVKVCEGCISSEKTLKEAFESLKRATEIWLSNTLERNGL